MARKRDKFSTGGMIEAVLLALLVGASAVAGIWSGIRWLLS
ncbi:hypothetical protein [Sphingomonas sp.]|jgi:hypothetical protein|nr:hypothetical protein [Sphingomonas sp.]